MYNCFQEVDGGLEGVKSSSCELPGFSNGARMSPEEVFARVTSSEAEIESLWSELACARDAWKTDGRHVRAVLQAFNNTLNGMHSLNDPVFLKDARNLNGPALRTSLSELEDLFKNAGVGDPWLHVLEQVIWTLRSIPAKEDEDVETADLMGDDSDLKSTNAESEAKASDIQATDDSDLKSTNAESDAKSSDIQGQIVDIDARHSVLDTKVRELANLLGAEYTARTTETFNMQSQVGSLSQEVQSLCRLVEGESALSARVTLQSQMGSLTQEVQDLRRLVEGERALSVALREDLCLRFGCGATDMLNIQSMTQAKASCSNEVNTQISTLRTELREEFSSLADAANSALHKQVADSYQQLKDTVSEKMEVLEAIVTQCGPIKCQSQNYRKRIVNVRSLSPSEQVQHRCTRDMVNRMSSSPSTLAPVEQAQQERVAVTVRRISSVPSLSPRERQANASAEVSSGCFSAKSMCPSRENLLQVHASSHPLQLNHAAMDTSPTRHFSPFIARCQTLQHPQDMLGQSAGTPRQDAGVPMCLQTDQYWTLSSASPPRYASSEPLSSFPVSPGPALQSYTGPRLTAAGPGIRMSAAASLLAPQDSSATCANSSNMSLKRSL